MAATQPIKTAKEATQLSLFADQALVGYRLDRFEVLNWGTFDQKIWTMQLDGRNALLTGDIGSGKSTLVDALTTLFVPPQKASYNKAAGSETKERSLASYVLGYYKSERQGSLGSAKPVSLRERKTYSVILAVFSNAGFNKQVTLAGVFWFKPGEESNSPERLYVVCEDQLSIARDFSGFGQDIAGLRKQLKDRGAEYFSTYPPYAAWFRRRFGISSDQAMDLFHQTVSMKSVGNLTSFVRTHMLEAFPVEERIQHLLQHFDNLTAAYEEVLKAKKQVAMLEPLVAQGEEYRELESQTTDLRLTRDAIPGYMADKQEKLLEEELEELEQGIEETRLALSSLDEELEAMRQQKEELSQQLRQKGGDRLAALKKEISQHEKELASRQQRVARFQELCGRLADKLDVPKDITAQVFVRLKKDFGVLRTAVETQDVDLQNRRNETGVRLHEKQQEFSGIRKEIQSLRARVSNIDDKQIALRQDICSALGIDERDMPFAGELLQVREDEKDWEGAIERLLHGFGLSLLVPDERYAEVAAYVDRTHLRGRLVYYRVRDSRQMPPEVGPDSLVHKLQIKPDSPYYTWMEREMAMRFDLVCCRDQDRFRREQRAITMAGQIKSPGGKHEKDDRHRLDDRRYYVLGWSNAEKIAALEQEAFVLGKQIASLQQESDELAKAQKALRKELETLSSLSEYSSFQDLDVESVLVRLSRLSEELKVVEARYNQAAALKRRYEELGAQIKESEKVHKDKNKQLGALESSLEYTTSFLEAVQERLLPEDDPLRRQFPALDKVKDGKEDFRELVVDACPACERYLTTTLTGEVEKLEKRMNKLQDAIVRAMADYCHAWPLATREVDVNIGSLAEFNSMLAALHAEGLPKFEKRFKDLLNENTLREIANFSSQLMRERETIRERIDQINGSLADIDYNPDRFIRLEARLTTDPDIRDFQSELRACTEGSLTGSDEDEYSEAKFVQVKQILERFKGRPESAEADLRWTRRVTDVRQWFEFAASERWREEDTEYEHYADSSGKSGGQKEKLAYTVLAASLAYHFGLDWKSSRSRSFRFAVIDEAFGRGSDESAHYALKLFEQLGLQLLIVTPLQKIHIIEPFVAHVGYVQNRSGQSSSLTTLSIETFRKERDKYLEGQAAASGETDLEMADSTAETALPDGEDSTAAQGTQAEAGEETGVEEKA